MKNRNSMFTTILLACFGFLSGAQAVVPAPDGGYPGGNTAEGQNALLNLTSGQHNTALGYLSLKSDNTGGYNTAVGSGTLFANTADGNTATGTFALLSNTTGGTFAGTFGEFDVGPNTAVGTLALGYNTTAGANTAVGYQALGNMTIGVGSNLGGYSTAVGFKALASADTSNGTGGHSNDAFGYEALAKTTTGFQNVGIGALTLFNNLVGTANTAAGHGALFNNTGSLNTALGYFAGADATTGSGNVYIGTNVEGSAGESNHTYIRNINTTTVSGGGTDTVTMNLSSGLLGHLSSSRRYKEDIQPMDKASETLFALKPVTFRYKKGIDQSQSLDYGLIAEEVAQVDPKLAVRDGKGQIESVRYTAINAMLLNEFLKEHKKVQELTATVAQQQKGMEVLTAQLKEQAAQIQKVSAQFEVSKPAAKFVVTKP
jgi:trimeric autotransporter adhesin